MPRPEFQSRAAARLIIHRAPSFGNEERINLYIDGAYVGTIGYAESYSGLLPAGDHIATMKQVPHLNDVYPFSEQRIRVAPGWTTVFTAIWRDSGTRIRLERS